MQNEQTAGEKYSPVNKGHFFDLEPPERVAAFYAKLSCGWEVEYKEYRRLWDELPKIRKLTDYPLLVDLETVSRCNLKCPMCPTVTDEFIEKRVTPFKKGQLNYNVVKKIIAEVAGKIYSLRLSWIGEPTLHPRLVDAVRLAKESGIKEVSFLTNGYRLHLDYFIKLAEAGVDLITISVDGMGETYNQIRKPLNFEETLKKLQGISDYKKANGLEKPLIKIQGVWPAIRENPEGFYNTFAPIVDLIAFNPLIDYLHNDSDIVYEDNFSCPQHYQRVVIGSNGRAAMCSSDDFMDIDIGDIATQTIHEIWHGEKFRHVRETHEQDEGFKRLKPCKNCFYPRKAAADEEAVINGRTVRIENYINRAQIVGK
ncbi:MAG: radical SAM/SPASM domain-containing protein [Methylovulum sp.]|nr:radical SAM/SPASM domain-containing protein [Methylovulum sp.]